MKKNEYNWEPEEFKNYYESYLKNNSVIKNIEDRKTHFILHGLNLKKSDIVMDLGCGYGRTSKLLSPHVDKIIGCDINPNNLTFATRYVSSSNFSIKQLDLNSGDLPFSDNSIDKIIADNITPFFDEKRIIELIIEFKRVLKPSGIIFFNFLSSNYYFKIVEIFYSYLRVKNYDNKKNYYSTNFFNKTLNSFGFTAKFYGESFIPIMKFKSIYLIPKILWPLFIKMDNKYFESKINIFMRSLFCIAKMK